METRAVNVTAAVLIIGDEILSGRTQDVNLNTIARFLATHGVDLAEARVIGDVKGDIVAAIQTLRDHYDYVLTTGGIGPTHDDITADCVAEVFGAPLQEHPEILAILEARWPDELTPARRRMARVPHGGVLIKNPLGGPPGFLIDNVFVLAGVPQVMRGMLDDVGWRLKGGALVISRTVRVDGVGEGLIAGPLERVADAHPALSLASYPFFSEAGFGSNLVLRGRDGAELESTLRELVNTLEGDGITSILIDPPEVRSRATSG